LIGLILPIFHVHRFRLILTLLLPHTGSVLFDELRGAKAFDLEMLKVGSGLVLS